MYSTSENVDISTYDVIFPVPAHIACGLDTKEEMQLLPLQEILYRLREFYKNKIVFLS